MSGKYFMATFGCQMNVYDSNLIGGMLEKRGMRPTGEAGEADVLIVNPPVALAIDYKTGKVLEDSQQLALMAACVFAHYPAVQAIRTEFWWLKEDATSRDDFRRSDMPEMWRGIWPRIVALKQAHDTMTFPPKSGGLCKRYCPVVSCPYHGK